MRTKERTHSQSRSLSTAILVLLTGIATDVSAQLTVSPQTDLQALATTIAGTGVTISNPVINCHAEGYGTFTYSGSVLGLPEGVLLTSGRIANAVGPNDADNTSFQAQTNGNSLLNVVTGRTTRDACQFEFDIIPSGDSLRFNFVFASEEYNEWVGSQYNDVFGFFISGPGIPGDPGIGNDHNIALIPGTNQAVTINNVNNGSNQTYYYDNAGGQYIQYDGMTRGLYAASVVQPCQQYHLKLVVADASDRKFDSGVFIERIRSNQVVMSKGTVNGTPYMVEGCNPGWVRFTRPVAQPTALNLTYHLRGTATNGTDYAAIGNTDPNVAKNITIPANQTSATVNVDPIADGISEPMENLLFILGNPLCPNMDLDSLLFDINDTLIATLSPNVARICRGDSVQLSVTGGSTYQWSPGATLSSSNGSQTWARPITTTSYTVQVHEGSCSQSITRQVRVSDIALSATSTRPLCNGQSNGALNLTATGGIPPYLFAWTGPNGFTSSSEDLVGIGAGTYTVTVSDAIGCSRTQAFNVSTPSPLTGSLTPSIQPFGENIACHGGNTGTLTLAISGGTAPYGVQWTGPNGYSSTDQNLSGLRAGTYSVVVTDANGCTYSATFTMTEPTAIAPSISGVVHVNCFGENIGEATASATGGLQPYTYSWNTTPVQTAATATGLAPGTYTVTVRDGYLCTSTSTVIINGPAAALSTALVASAPVSCNAGQNGSASITASGGTAPYTFSWNTAPAQTTASATGLAAGTWTCSVTDARGCATDRSVTITQPAAPLGSAISARTNVSCHGNNSGSATVSASGGTAPYTYSWNTAPIQTGPTATGLGAGTWQCTITDVRGCSVIQDVIITQPSAALDASITGQTAVSCHGGSNASATLLATGGTAPYTYVWNTLPVQNTATASNLGVGTRTCVVTDANGCQVQRNVLIAQPASALGVTISGTTQVLCHGANTGSATASANGGTAPYTYSWNTAPAQQGAQANGLAAGQYTVLVTDVNGCTATSTATISQPAAEVDAFFESITHESCFGAHNGAATISVTGGSGSYTITWDTDPAVSGPTASGLAPGLYMVSVTDNNGCTHTKQYPVTIIGATAPLAMNTDATDISCQGSNDGSIDLSVSGGNAPYAHIWTGPDAQSTGLEDIDGLSPGDYSLHLVDFYGCVKDTIITISEPAALAVTADVTTAACQGSATGAVDITVTGGSAPYTYAWSGPTGYTADTEDLNSIGAGGYVLQLTDAHGCSITEAFNVSQPGSLQLSAISTSHPGGWGVSCANANNGAIDLTVTGGTGPFTISWSGPAGFNANTEDITGLTSGSYHVSVDDANGCTAVLTRLITGPAVLGATLVPSVHGGTNISCHGADDGEINATITGGTPPYSYLWSGPNGFTAGTEDIAGLQPGTYTLVVTDLNGCTTNVAQTLTGPASIASSFTTSTTPAGTAIGCAGASSGSIQLMATGGSAPLSIQWTGPNGFNASSAMLSGLAAGTYSALITDANGCFASTQVDLDEPAPLEMDAAVSDHLGTAISCANGNDGSIDVTITGGAGSPTFQWTASNGFTSSDEDVSGLGAATYTVVVTDVNGCVSTTSFNLAAPIALTGSAQPEPLSCAGANDGSIDLIIQGGTMPYSIDWSGPNGFTSTDEDPSGLAPGSYSASIIDANGCSANAAANVTAPAPLQIAHTTSLFASGDQIACAGGSDGSIALTIEGGTGNYSISWSNGAGFTADTTAIDGLDAGTYQVTVMDQNGCTAQATIELAAPQPMDITATLSEINGNNVTCAGAADGSIDLSIAGGAAPFTVVWNDGVISEDRTGLDPGTYSAEITDANGCSASVSYTLTAPATVEVNVTATTLADGKNITCHGGADGQLEAMIQGGTAPYTIAWTGPDLFNASTAMISGLAAGTYALTVTDANGCSHVSTHTLTQPEPLVVDLASVTYSGGFNIPCATLAIGVFNATVTGGTPTYTYAWTGPDGFTSDAEDLMSLVAGVYDLAVTDALGCTGSASATLTAPDELEVVIAITDFNGDQVSCAGNDGGIEVSVTGGAPDYQFEWIGPNGFTSQDEDLSDLGPGTYSLSVTDQNGCRNDSLITLDAPEPLAASFQRVSNPCASGLDGSIDLSITGGGSSYAVLWSGPDGFTSTDQDPAGLANGAYTVQITDDLGCAGTFTTLLDGPLPLAAGPYVSFYGSYNLQCQGDSTGVIELDPSGGTAPYTIGISGPNGYQSQQAGNSGLVAGDYAVHITDASGCATDTLITLSEPVDGVTAELTLSVYPSGTNVSCFGASDGSIDATITGGSGPYTFSWRGPDEIEFSTEDVTGLPAGDYNYELVVTDANNCSFFTVVTLTQPDSALSTTTSLVSYNGSGTSCHGTSDGAIDLTITGGNGGYTQSWSGPDGFSSTLEDLSGLAAGTYTVTATDMNGCTSVEVVDIIAPEPVLPTLNTSNFPGGSAISCANASDGSIETIVTGGAQPFTYAWTGPNGLTSNNPMITGLGPGAYCVVITDANGCEAQDCSTLEAPGALEASTAATSAACAGDNGTVDLTVVGGSAPYQYEWDNGATTEDLIGLAPGDLNVVVTDANGCITLASATIIGSPQLEAQANISASPCHGEAAGSVDLTVLSGSAPFNFIWNHGPTTEDLNGLPAGSYTVSITDAAGCTFEGTYAVVQPDAITFDTLLSSHASGHNISVFGAADGSIANAVSGGNAPYLFSWSNGATTESISGLAAGTYTLLVTDANGCTATLTVELDEPSDLTMPTAFSPNGDGDNERFVVRGIEAYPKNLFTVVNRWGNVVYERPDYRNEWSGESNKGGQLPNGTYFVILSINDGTRTLQGFVDLRR
ncbi:MAG: choice-of-anchor L domain-containing protein [Flavobacteriales bacterium]|nr:choice-of-anchor L domain-containing protein [Flavobacteriales bacterium]